MVARSCAALCERTGDVSVTASFGLVLLGVEASTPSAALQLADERMYARKAAQSRPRGLVAERLPAVAPMVAAASGDWAPRALSTGSPSSPRPPPR